MGPGLYPELSRDEYDAVLGLNNSTIKIAVDKSMQHAYEGLVHPSKSTDAMKFGNALHTMMLEPELFKTRYAPMPVNARGDKLSRRTVDGEIAWDEFDDRHAGKHPLKQNKINELIAMRESVMRHPTARALIENAVAKETSFFWDHPLYLFECKAQMDLLTEYEGRSVVADVKSCEDASPAGFKKAVAKYSYMTQHVWYLEGLNEISEADRWFYFIAVEKKYPYLTACYEIDALNVFEGQHRCDLISKRWDKALDEQNFPGYPGGINIVPTERWAMTHERENYEEEEEDGVQQAR